MMREEFYWEYVSPLGGMVLVSDGEGLVEARFLHDRFYKPQRIEHCRQQLVPVLALAVAWLDAYFAGQQPEICPALHTSGTVFQEEVWALLKELPYGALTTYKELAERLAQKRGLAKMSAQAVGGAVGHNPLALFIPCHRVVGTSGSLTGYAAGLEKKVALLRLEGVNMQDLFVPKR